jgi:hypothetical protein
LKLLAEMPYDNSKIIIITEIHNFLVAYFFIITRELPLSASEIIAQFLSGFYFICDFFLYVKKCTLSVAFSILFI